MECPTDDLMLSCRAIATCCCLLFRTTSTVYGTSFHYANIQEYSAVKMFVFGKENAM